MKSNDTYVLSYWDSTDDPRTPKQITVPQDFLHKISEILKEHCIYPTVGVLMKINITNSLANSMREIVFVAPVHFNELEETVQKDLLTKFRIIGDYVVKSSYFVNNTGVYIPVSINHIKAYET